MVVGNNGFSNRRVFEVILAGKHQHGANVRLDNHRAVYGYLLNLQLILEQSGDSRLEIDRH